MTHGFRPDALIPAVLQAGLLAAFGGLWLAVWLAASQPLTLTVTPRIAHAPATLNLVLRVPPHADNRVLTVGTDGGDYVRSSGWELEGEQAHGQFHVEWRNVPEGEYAVIAYLHSSTSVRGRQQVQVTVR